MNWRIWVGVVVISVCALAVRADSADELFEQNFGAEAKQNKSASIKDQVAFARKLLDATKEPKIDPQYGALLCAKVEEWAMGVAEGYDIGLEALEKHHRFTTKETASLEQKSAELIERHCKLGSAEHRRRAADDRIAQLLEQADEKLAAHSADDAAAILKKAEAFDDQASPDSRTEIAARTKRLTALRACLAKIETLKAAIQKNPEDVRATRDLVQAVAVELDDPAAAVQYATAAKDPTLIKILTLATKAPADLTPEENGDVGEWYRQQSPKAGDLGKRPAAERALACFIAVQDNADTAAALKSKAKSGQQEMEKLLASLDRSAGRRTIDLLRLVQPAKDKVHGAWTQGDNGITSGGDRISLMKIPYHPPEEYDLRMELKRQEGKDGIIQVLCYGETCFALNVGSWGNRVCGVNQVDGKVWSENGTKVQVDNMIPPDKRVVTLVQVRRSGITLLVNGTKIASYKLDYSRVSPSPYLKDLKGCLGFGTEHGVFVEFQKIELIEVSGRGKPIPR